MIHIELSKQPKKYLGKCTLSDNRKLCTAIEGLKNLHGDIIRLQGRDEYRLKLPPYRILFKYNKDDKVITITRINTRGDVYKKGG